MGWVNDFDREGLLDLLSGSGWKISTARLLKMRWRTREYLVVGSSA